MKTDKTRTAPLYKRRWEEATLAEPFGHQPPVGHLGTNFGPVGAGRDHLWSLLRRFRLSRREQVVVLTVLDSPTPLSAWQVAKRAKLAYPHAKATIRTLIAWGILERESNSLYFQPDPAQWGPPTQRGKH